MAVIPNSQDLPAPPLSLDRRPAQVDASDFTGPARSLQGLAGSAEGLAQQLTQNSQTQEDYDAQKKFINFDLQQEKALQDAKQAAPQDAQNFTTGFRSSYDQGARDFMTGIPERLKPEFDKRLVDRAAHYEEQAYNWELQRKTAAHQADALDNLQLLQNRAGADPSTAPDSIARGADLLRSSGIDALTQRKMLKDHGEATEETAVRSRIETAINARDYDAVQSIVGDLKKTPQPPETGGLGASDLSSRLETGKSNPLEGVASIAKDSKGSESYGNYGLNSQADGSAWKFRDAYGPALGLTANPGTPEFDAQWKAAAAKDPAALRAAEQDWHAKTVAPAVTAGLTNLGLPPEVVNDPRVQTYFEDRAVQQGTGSIDQSTKHSERIKAAWQQSGGDPVAFLKAVSAADTDPQNLQRDFPSALASGVYSAKANETRVNGRLEGALKATDREDAGVPSQDTNLVPEDVPYKYLTPAQRLTLTHVANLANRNNAQAELGSAIDQIKDTGTEPQGRDGRSVFDNAIQTLNDNEKAAVLRQRQAAHWEYDAVSPLAAMSPDQATAHFAKLAKATDDALHAQTGDPEAGTYKDRKAVQALAQKKWDKVQKDRDDDPALSVSTGEGKDPGVDAAYRLASQTRDVIQPDGSTAKIPAYSPQTVNQKVIDARLAAQEQRGIPQGERSPLTKDEGKALLNLGTDHPADLDPVAFDAKMKAAATRARDLYGPQYDVFALQKASEDLIKDKAKRDAAGFVITKLARGEALDPADYRRIQQSWETGRLSKFMDHLDTGGPTAVPVSPPVGGSGNPFASAPAPAAAPGPAQQPSAPSRVAVPFTASGPAKAAPAQIDYLRNNPAAAQEFDKRFGPGAAARILAPSLSGTSQQ